MLRTKLGAESGGSKCTLHFGVHHSKVGTVHAARRTSLSRGMKDGRGIELRGEFGREEDDERGNLALVHTRMYILGCINSRLKARLEPSLT